MITFSKIREALLDALRLDLVGPTTGIGNPEEILNQARSRWYLTGFLVPTEADARAAAVDTTDELENGETSIALERRAYCQEHELEFRRLSPIRRAMHGWEGITENVRREFLLDYR